MSKSRVSAYCLMRVSYCITEICYVVGGKQPRAISGWVLREPMQTDSLVYNTLNLSIYNTIYVFLWYTQKVHLKLRMLRSFVLLLLLRLLLLLLLRCYKYLAKLFQKFVFHLRWLESNISVRKGQINVLHPKYKCINSYNISFKTKMSK